MQHSMVTQLETRPLIGHRDILNLEIILAIYLELLLLLLRAHLMDLGIILFMFLGLITGLSMVIPLSNVTMLLIALLMILNI
jgi:hypothetical protein